jgi:hypothetical protein
MSNHRQTKGNARRRSFIDNMAYSLSQMIYGKEIRINRALNQGELEEYLQAALDELLEMEQRRMAQEADLAAVKRASAIPGVPSLGCPGQRRLPGGRLHQAAIPHRFECGCAGLRRSPRIVF